MHINTHNARVTIVMTMRERHGLSVAAINAVLQNTTQPYHFIYADVQSPDWLRAYLATSSKQWGFEWLRFDEHLWPQQLRNKLIERIDTEYVVYIDNDVIVQPGWLDHLLACADETQAGIVGPLYLWGNELSKPKVHMAGGKLVKSLTADGMVLEESHVDLDIDLEKVMPTLVRRPCDFAEFHCLLIRADLVRHKNVLDDTIYCVHEHIDTALSVIQQGYPVYLEPASRVVYLAFTDYQLEDLALFKSRWSVTDAEASISAFSKKWNVINDDRSFGGVRNFLKIHKSHVDPLSTHSVHNVAMDKQALKQTRSDLFDVAIERGYQAEELKLLAFSYHIAHVLMDGGYRPCGRPFINHLIGTASVLLHFGFKMEVVAAGLLHSVYSHCPAHTADPKTLIDGICAMLGGKNSPLEKRIRAYAKRELRWQKFIQKPEEFFKLSVLDAEIIAIATANEIDMHLSGEYRYSGRADEIDQGMSSLIEYVCQVLNVNGLHTSLQVALAQKSPGVPQEMMMDMPSSYRIANDKVNLVRMQNNNVLEFL